MRKNLRNYFFTFIVLSGLCISSLYIVLKNPKLISDEENRHLKTFQYLELTSFFDGSFQNQIESAYTDQFPKRNFVVNFKNKIDDTFRKILLNNISELTLVKIDTTDGFPLLRLGNSDRMINTIILDTPENQERFKTRALEINQLQKRNPDTKIYVYNPTQAHETSLFDNENNITSGANNLWKTFEENIEVPFKRFNLDSLDLYKKAYYMSDHHPTSYGADIFYNEIMNMLKPDDETLKPTFIDCHVGKTFYGTFANRTGRITAPDEFCLYMYDIKKYDVFVEGKKKDDYVYRSDFKNYVNDDTYPYHYNIAYKIYDPIMEIDTNRDELENLLIIGDSYSNSVLDLISSHYNKTFRVAPYNYLRDYGEMFNYDKFIKENDIDTVLFMYTVENYYYKDIYGDRYEQNAIIENGGK